MERKREHLTKSERTSLRLLVHNNAPMGLIYASFSDVTLGTLNEAYKTIVAKKRG